MTQEITPFIAMTPGAAGHLVQNPLVQKALKEGVFKDIWGSEFSAFMGIGSDGSALDTGEILDNAQGRNTSFTADVSIYRCVDIRGAAVASVPLKVYDDPDPDKRKEVAHDALGVLQATNPFGYVAGPQLLRYSLGSRDLHGSFAWNLVMDSGARLRGSLPREIYWIQPALYKPVAGRDLSPPQPKLPFAGLKVRQNNKEVFVPAQNLVYAPSYSPTDPLRGTSKISSLRLDLNLRMYGANSNLWFFRNNQRPDVVVTGAFSPTTENVNLMRRIWRTAFGGDHSRGPAFLPADMKVQLLTMAAKDAEWLGQRHAAREDILAAFGVPPPVYGDLSRATYENIRSAWSEFWRSNMIPELDEIAWFLTQQFLWKWPDAQRNRLYFGFDYTQIEALQEDSNAIWERVNSMLQRLNESVKNNALLPDQMRQIAQSLFKTAGLPDAPWAGTVPGGSMFYVQGNRVPIIEASVQAMVDVMAARAAVTGGETNKPGNGRWTLPDASMRAPIASRPSSPASGGPAGLPPPSRPPALPSPKPAAKDLIMRRLKRHFQDQQTAALRAMRATEPPEHLWDVKAGATRAREILLEGLEMAGIVLDMAELEARANAIEGEMLLAVDRALRSDQPLEAVRQVFREAIEQRAAAIAQEIYEETAA